MPIALPGIGVSPGVAIGTARILDHRELEIPEYVLPESLVEEEIARFRKALQKTVHDLTAIRDKIPRDAPEDIAAFIDTHLLMLEDSTLVAAPIEIIMQQRCNAEWALQLQQDALVAVFDQMDDPYLKTRRDDIEHVIRRVQQTLLQETRDPLADRGEGVPIVLAEDLSPGDIVLLHQQNIGAIVTERGAPTSHTAILARSLGIPAVVATGRAYQYVSEGETVIVDGERGVLLAAVDERTLAHYRKRRQAARRIQVQLRRLKDEPALTQDGRHITLHVNIELPEDLPSLKKVGAAGVGLYRTEFLFLNRTDPADEHEQFRAYQRVARALQGAPLTVRTLDLGGDKQWGAARKNGPNPALGLRAIRLCMKEPALFRTQLRAILRASAYGRLRLLVPMLTTVNEAILVRQLVQEVKAELRREGVRYDEHIPIGGMIEVPAAALCADHFTRHLDFFSIGTNDLIQYTLATDRVDDDVNYLFEPTHLAVLRLIRTTLQAAGRAGIPVSMCGEMAGDPLYTRLLIGMGLTEFSMPPRALLAVKRVVTNSHAGRLKRQVDRLFRSQNPGELPEHLEQLNRES